jgi:hypothetical protein
LLSYYKMKKDNKKTPKKTQNFYCEICDFITSNKRDFTRHKMTRKHKMVTKKPQIDNNFLQILIFNCENCGKEYKHRSGLSRHKKKCKINKKLFVEMLSFTKKNIKNGNKKTPKKNYKKIDKKEEILDEKDEIIKKLKKDVEIAKLQREADIANYENELLKKDCKYKDDIIGIYKKKKGDVYKNNTFNTNNSISINVFLNKNCKNAMNLTDFVDQIKVQLEDVVYQKDHGCAEGITNILTKQLQDMNPMERPIHCSDEKKLQFYIKEDDKWFKNDTGEEMEKSLRKIQVKQVQAMKEWEDAHPNFDNSDELLEERNKLMAEILHGCEDSTEMKKNVKEIKKNVAKILSIQEVMDSIK